MNSSTDVAYTQSDGTRQESILVLLVVVMELDVG